MNTHNLCFMQKYEKYQNFSSLNFQFLVEKFLMYLKRHVFELSMTLLMSTHSECFCEEIKYQYSMDEKTRQNIRAMITRDVRNELLISICKFHTHFMPSKYSPWLEMQSFSRCIHFLKASRYADLGTVIRY